MGSGVEASTGGISQSMLVVSRTASLPGAAYLFLNFLHVTSEAHIIVPRSAWRHSKIIPKHETIEIPPSTLISCVFSPLLEADSLGA